LPLEAIELLALPGGKFGQLLVIGSQRFCLLHGTAVVVEHLPTGIVELLDTRLRGFRLSRQSLAFVQRGVQRSCVELHAAWQHDGRQ